MVRGKAKFGGMMKLICLVDNCVYFYLLFISALFLVLCEIAHNVVEFIVLSFLL